MRDVLSSEPTLHHEFVHAPRVVPRRWMLVLHGIYGAGRNWGSVARRFVEARPDWGAMLVDLRGHGQSGAFPPPHTVDACADDVARTVAAAGVDAAAVLGHSFGGKVALRYARRAEADPAAPHLERLWVVDSTPAARPPGGSAWAMLDVLRKAPGPFPDRNAGVAAVEAAGYATPVARWMSTNLVVRDDGSYAWRLDSDVMQALLEDFFALDAWDVIEHPPAGTRVIVVKAAESNILDDDARHRIEAAGLATGAVEWVEVDGGHWLNADNPDALHDLLVERMPGS